MQQTEETFFKALAERPDDRALRSIFCDWLLEQGDARGEAMALFDKGDLTFVERKRLAKLQRTHAGRWLGPLKGSAVIDDCRFAGGLLHTLKFPANLSIERYAALTGEPRLATLHTLAIEPGRAAAEVGAFLAHPVLARLVRLEGDVATLVKAQGLSSAPQVLRVSLWHPREELEALAACVALRSAEALSLSIVDFVNPREAEELAATVVGSGVLNGRKQVELVARDATIEGVVQWLRVASAQARGLARDRLQRWAVEYAQTHLGLEGEHFEHLIIDARAKGGTGEIAVAAAVLAMLDGIGVKRVDVVGIPGGRLKKDELNTLRAAVRRLKTVEELRVGGVRQSP